MSGTGNTAGHSLKMATAIDTVAILGAGTLIYQSVAPGVGAPLAAIFGAVALPIFLPSFATLMMRLIPGGEIAPNCGLSAARKAFERNIKGALIATSIVAAAGASLAVYAEGAAAEVRKKKAHEAAVVPTNTQTRFNGTAQELFCGNVKDTTIDQLVNGTVYRIKCP